MSMHTSVRLVILGTFLSIIFVLNECKKLDGSKFPVHSTPYCPRNESEWNERSSVLNCNKTNGYTCLPNENFTELLEFCYTQPWILIEEGYCLYLKGKGPYLDSYSCRHFIQGCHRSSYQSIKIYEHPACISLGNGCFLAEKACKSSPKTTYRPVTTENEKDAWLWAVILIGIIVFIVCFSSLMLYLYRKRRSPDIDRKEEHMPLITGEPQIEKDIFDQWEQEDDFFIPTKAFKEVEKHIKSSNLVIVTGHSGSGKSAIIQHIALKHQKQGWTVRRIQNIDDIRKQYSSNQFQKDKTIFVLNDPFGNESFDEILYNSWKTREEEFQQYIETTKLMMSCRNHTINDGRLARYLRDKSHIINIDDDTYKLSLPEKRQILTKYTSAMNLSEKDRDEIVKVEMHFPLLCKLYSSKKEYTNKGIGFFTEPVEVLREEIKGFRQNDKGKYCALALLVLFNDDLCVSDLLKHKDTEETFKYTLKLCGLQENTPPYTIGDFLYSIKDCFVKKVGNTYNFYHDFVMEVTTHVFGTDYPKETIKYADIGFLRRRVRQGYCEDNKDSFTIYLEDRYTEELGERLYAELFGKRLLDVVLNPCLRNEKVIKVLKEKIRVADHPENLQMMLKTKDLKIDKHVFDRTSKSVLMSKLDFLLIDDEVSPLFALIVFCHTQLSQYFIHTLQQKQIDLRSSILISAMCCNGSKELFNNVFKNNAKEFLKKAWGGLYPIHIVSVFQNYELLHELINIGVDVNQKTGDNYQDWTALMLAAGNDTQEYDENTHDDLSKTRRDKTVQHLLSNGADINLGGENGVSPLYIACQNGYDSTVQLLLSNKADINICKMDGLSPLLIASQNGHIKTVQLLLKYGADINLCEEDGTSPLFIACHNGQKSLVECLLSNGADINVFKEKGGTPLLIACQNGYDNTVLLLLSKAADINLCDIEGASPLHIACQNGHDSTVQHLLNNGANINLCMYDGASPLYIACQNRHDTIVQLLLSNGAIINLCDEKGGSPLNIACQNGHESTVRLFLSNGADINLCDIKGVSPLYIACQNGQDDTVKLLLSNGANINSCINEETVPLYIACQNRHDRTVQRLMRYGADNYLCKENGASPLHIACQNGHNSTVELLLHNGADINICEKNGTSPLHKACKNVQDSTVQLLLSNGANINLCMKDGASPLFIACQNGHDSTVQLLLTNRADINVCMKDGASPLHIACQNGHHSTVQLLLSNGAAINVCKEKGVTPLLIACQNGYYNTVQLLLSKAADINLCDIEGASPLHIACQNGHDTTVQLLLNNGANINLCMYDGASPLFIACQNGHDTIVQLLLSNEADINLCKRNKVTPLYIASQNGHYNTVQYLLSGRANLNLCMNEGASPLYIACQNGHESIARLLLSNGADINLRMNYGTSPLYIACKNGHENTVKLLLSLGADINLCVNDGASPLYIACANDYYGIVIHLLRCGADSNLRKNNGASPLYIACKNGSFTLVLLLLEKGADLNLCMIDGASPLYIACQNGRDSIRRLLLSHGADNRLYMNDETGLFQSAWHNGHDFTRQPFGEDFIDFS